MIEKAIKQNGILLKCFELKPDFPSAEANSRILKDLLLKLNVIRNLNSEFLTEPYR